MNMPQPLLQTDLDGLELLTRGKVRDIYRVGADLLIVATDRISAYDSILGTGIPWKGTVLTPLTLVCPDSLPAITPHHLLPAAVHPPGT